MLLNEKHEKGRKILRGCSFDREILRGCSFDMANIVGVAEFSRTTQRQTRD